MAYITGEVGAFGFAGLAVALLAFIRFFLVRQISDLRDDVDTLSRKMRTLEQEYDRERGLKHMAYNDVARTVMALDLVQRLAKECNCGVLTPLTEIVDKLMNELETIGTRRHDDPEGVTP